MRKLRSGMATATPPTDVRALIARAAGLEGATLEALARAVDVPTHGTAVRTKGSPGQILERALGATGGASKVVDFEALGVELKTIPVDLRGVPIESTYVCTLTLADAEVQTWETSWVRAKLARVLFVPLVGADGVAWRSRTVGAPVLWSPTSEQERVLRGDFDEIVGLIGIGRIEDVTAHLGQWLQVRPKARHGSVRTIAWDGDGEPIATVPRGFYLRSRFTRTLLAAAVR
jgi:DNA mismatch repair protein MutH